MSNLLSLTTFIPLLGAAILALFLRGDDQAAQSNAKWVALATTGFTFLVSLFILAGFDRSVVGFQMVEERAWIGGLTYKMGVDGISLVLVLLTTFIMPLVIGACWGVTNRVKEYMIAFLILETLMLGVFMALDLVLFYLFFEGQLIPMFLIIGIWGGKERIYAAFKFFLYTFLGSVLMLVAMMAIWVTTGTTDIAHLYMVSGMTPDQIAVYAEQIGRTADEVARYQIASDPVRVLGLTIPGGLQTLFWIAFIASFAVKLPMWPVHTWLPDAHVQAPTAGSVVLASILLKMGGYGFLRFSLPMFPIASEMLGPLMLWLGAIAIVYTSLVALVQDNMKKLIAYSSVAHMGYVTLGVFAANQQGLDGAVFQMLSHGFVSGALFLIVGVIYDRIHTLDIDAYGGLVNRMPVYALVYMFFTMANLGLPGTSGFVGEFLTLVAAFRVNTWVAFVAATGVILSASYALWLYRRIVLGDLIKESLRAITDMSRREKLIFAPLIAMTLLLGVWPSLATDLISTTTTQLVSQVESATQMAAAAGQMALN